MNDVNDACDYLCKQFAGLGVPMTYHDETSKGVVFFYSGPYHAEYFEGVEEVRKKIQEKAMQDQLRKLRDKA
jgi:hypothetical protein